MRVSRADVESLLPVAATAPVTTVTALELEEQFTVTSPMLPNRTLWPTTFRSALSSSSGRSLSVAARTTESYTPDAGPCTPHYLFYCALPSPAVFFVTLLKLSTRNAPLVHTPSRTLSLLPLFLQIKSKSQSNANWY